MNIPANSELATDKDVQFTDAEFHKFRDFVYERTGISLSDAKKLLLYRRLISRLEFHGFQSFTEYFSYLKQGDDKELELFTNAVTTNLTSFFREQHHFDYLSETLLPELVKKKRHGEKKLRIWSAGCSTGEEAYSIAITLCDALPDINSWDAKILCTDLDSQVLETCRAGIYPTEGLERVSSKIVDKWFHPVDGYRKPSVEVDPKLKQLTVFNQLNLMDPWPMKCPFDIIFCRNVFIYFDKPTQKQLIARYAQQLDTDGHLMLGHSETLHDIEEYFDLIGQTIYRKVST